MIPIVVLTNDLHLWLLRGFCAQFNRYWPGLPPVSVYGYNLPRFDLPPNFHFTSLGTVNAPIDQWSNGLLHVLGLIRDDYLILMLEDYWLDRRVNEVLLQSSKSLLFTERDALKVDLWGVQQQHARVVERREGYDVLQLPNSNRYSLSLQAALWNKVHLASVLRENESPWQTEIEGSKRLAQRTDLRVLSVSPTVLSYYPVWRTRKKQLDVTRLSRADFKELYADGALTPA